MSVGTRRYHRRRTPRPQIRLADIPMRKSLPLPAVLAERTVWEARASQLENLRDYFTCALTCAMVLAAGMLDATYLWLLSLPATGASWRWVQVYCKRYRLTNRRLLVISGTFFRARRNVLLNKVIGGGVKAPAIQRIFQRGDVRIASEGVRMFFTLHAVKRPHELLFLVLAEAERMCPEHSC